MKKQLINLYFFSLIALPALAQVPSYVPTNGLVGYWPFNGNANDESGNGNNGTVNGATLTSDRFGVANKAYNFDGVNDNILVENSNSLNPSILTLNVWIFANANNLAILEKGDITNASKHGYALTHNDFWQIQRGLKSSFGNGNCTSPTNSSIWGDFNSVSNSIWAMITVTIDQFGTVKHYLNGNLLYTGATAPLNSCNDPLSTLRFGGPHWSNDPEWFNGSLDDIGIWNRALTPQEVAALYNGCSNSLSAQPTDQSIELSAGNTAQFSVTSSAITASYQWQTNLGLGFQNLSDAGQYSGTATNTLSVNNVTLANNNQQFRCIVADGSCEDTTDIAVLTVIDDLGIEDLKPNGSKKLLKITDLNGKETPFRKNTVLLFIYEDGTLERVYEAE